MPPPPPLPPAPLTALPQYDRHAPKFPSYRPPPRRCHALRAALTPGPSPSDPSHRAATSWLLPPRALALARLLVALYLLAAGALCLVASTGASAGTGAGSRMGRLSVLVVFWAALYFALGAAHTGCYALTGGGWVGRWPRWLRAGYGVLAAGALVFPWLVTVVFWAMVFRPPLVSTFDAWMSTSLHAAGAASAAFEIVFTRGDMLPLVHVACVVVLMGIYFGLVFLAHGHRHCYVQAYTRYASLDRYELAPSLLVAAGIVVAVFFVVDAAIWLRKWLTEARLGWTGVFANEDRIRESRLGGLSKPDSASTLTLARLCSSKDSEVA